LYGRIYEKTANFTILDEPKGTAIVDALTAYVVYEIYDED
jgi:hypothetical protein